MEAAEEIASGPTSEASKLQGSFGANVQAMEEEGRTGGGPRPRSSARNSCVAAVLLQTVLLGVVTVVCVATAIGEPVTEWRTQTQHRYSAAVESWTANYDRSALAALGPTLPVTSDREALPLSRAILLTPFELTLDTAPRSTEWLFNKPGTAPTYPAARYIFAGSIRYLLSGTAGTTHALSLYIQMGTNKVTIFEGPLESSDGRLCLSSLQVFVYRQGLQWTAAPSMAERLAACPHTANNNADLPLTVIVRHVTDPENSVLPNPASDMFISGSKGLTGVTLSTFVSVAMLIVSLVVTGLQFRRTSMCENGGTREYESLRAVAVT